MEFQRIGRWEGLQVTAKKHLQPTSSNEVFCDDSRVPDSEAASLSDLGPDDSKIVSFRQPLHCNAIAKSIRRHSINFNSDAKRFHQPERPTQLVDSVGIGGRPKYISVDFCGMPGQ